MKYGNICKKHPCCFVVACVHKRSRRTGFVSSWKVLNTHKQLEQAAEFQEFYKYEGISGVVLIDTSGEDKLPPNKAAYDKSLADWDENAPFV